jgi:hypothetical protein
MNFVPQVLIAANCWGAGLEGRGVEPKHKGPPPIQELYDALKEKLVQSYPAQHSNLLQLEEILYQLNQDLDMITLESTGEIATAAKTLLTALDAKPTDWRNRIIDYA